MAQVLAEVRLAGSPLQTYRHVCAFFRSPDEFYTVLLPQRRPVVRWTMPQNCVAISATSSP